MTTLKTLRRVPSSFKELNDYIRNSAAHLLRASREPVTKHLAKSSSENICVMDFSDGMLITMENKSAGMGAPTLYFCTALEEADACELAHSIAVAPGETQMRAIDELGGALKRNLNVTNPSADQDGHCTVSFCPNWKRLGMDEDEMNKWSAFLEEWIPLYEKYSDRKETRTTAIKDKLSNVRKRFAAFVRPLLTRIEGERTVTIDDLEILRIKAGPLRDTEPSPVHGSHLATGAPVVSLKNMGGGMIDVKCRRDKDQTRPSMLKGFMIELRWLAGPPSPTDPDMSGLIAELSSKSHFQVVAGMNNLGKTFFCYVRWRHKTNPAILSPWTNLLQITIA